MKKIILFPLLFVFIASAMAQTIDPYALPMELSGVQAVDLIGSTTVVSTAPYIDLTTQITKLQGDLGTQNDNLNNNKNLLQKYGTLTFGSTIVNPDVAKLAALNASYASAIKVVKSNIDISKKNIATINVDIAKITQLINNRMNLDQSQQTFRQWTSFIYAVLIAIIILSFFFILFKSNAKDVTALLMGESGLQFITLFSLIIAIVLFGVLNILEGKELAAIISAIAGFILGKYNPGNNGAGGGNPGGGAGGGNPGGGAGGANPGGGAGGANSGGGAGGDNPGGGAGGSNPGGGAGANPGGGTSGGRAADDQGV